MACKYYWEEMMGSGVGLGSSHRKWGEFRVAEESEGAQGRSSLGNVLKYIVAISVKGHTKFCGIGGTIYEFWMHTEVN